MPNLTCTTVPGKVFCGPAWSMKSGNSAGQCRPALVAASDRTVEGGRGVVRPKCD